MGRLLSLGFEYMGTQQQLLVRVKENERRVEYLISVLDAELEQLLADNNIIVEENNCLYMPTSPKEDEQFMLRESIALALGKYLKKDMRVY